MWLLSRLTRNKAGGPAGKKACRTAINDKELSNCRQEEHEIGGRSDCVLSHLSPLDLQERKKMADTTTFSPVPCYNGTMLTNDYYNDFFEIGQQKLTSVSSN